MSNIPGVAGDHVVQAGDPGTGIDQPGANMGAEKPGTTKHDGVFTCEFAEPAKRGSAHIEQI
jgi:hypothetical protein